MPNKRSTAVIRPALACLALASSVCAQAQSNLSTATSLPTPAAQPGKPTGIAVGPMMAYPGIDFAIGHNDNLFLNDRNKKSSMLTVLSPFVRLEGKPGPHKFDLQFRVDDGRFKDSTADNYTNYSLLGNADVVFSGRAGLKLRGEHRYAIDPRGSTDRAGAATPDEYINQGIGGIFSYGAPGAKGRIELDGSAFTRRYQNNRAGTEAFDRDTNTLGGTFFWRVAPKTEILAQIQHTTTDYTLPTSTQDSSETRYLVGAKWDATAKTSGIFRVGRLSRDFNSAARQDFSGSSWDATVRWSPLTYSVLDFTTSKATNESTGTGDFLLSKNYAVSWNHAWNSRISTVANAGWKQDDFLGTGGGRIDKTTTLGVKVNYQIQRWLKASAGYEWSDRSSNNSAFDYKKNLWMFTLGAAI